MERTTIISIVTPLFNGRRFLEGAIENVIAQGIEEVEHIIVDGGSTDGSMEIVRRYAESYPHIRWISEPDRGQSDAMNKGIAMARGEFISFLNADDFYEPGLLQRVIDLIHQVPVSDRRALFLLGNTRVIDDQGRQLWINRPGYLRRNWMLTGLSFQSFPINPSAYFYHRSIHDRIGGYSTEGEHRSHMDLQFILRALPSIDLRYFDEVWGNFRFYRGTVTAELAATGKGVQEVMATLRSFHSSLPLRNRLVVGPLFRIARTRLYGKGPWLRARIRFALRQPGAAVRRALEILTGARP